LSRIWDALGGVYGSAFYSTYGQNPDITWLTQLEGLTKRQIYNGIKNLGSAKTDFHINAVEFGKICRLSGISPDGINSQAYVEFKPTERITDQNKISRSERKGREILANLKALFASTPYPHKKA
jgi:hypothetical protein